MKLYLTCRRNVVNSSMCIHEVWKGEVPPVYNDGHQCFIPQAGTAYVGQIYLACPTESLDMQPKEVKQIP